MSYRIKKLGWLPDPLDVRDRTLHDPIVHRSLARALPKTAAAIASGTPTPVGRLRADLRPWCSPIEDQGTIGACTAHAVIGALEYFERKTRGRYVDASRFFLYRATRRFLGWEDRGDTGAFIRSTIKALRLFGAPPEIYWPYHENDFDAEPEAFHYAFAQNFKAVEYFRLDENVDQLRSALDNGLPFAFGFSCFSSMFSDEAERSGVIPFPTPADSLEGGHAVLAVGYTDSHVLIRNSWGAGWGEGGYGYLPWEYFDGARPLATDCWALLNATWVPNDVADLDVDAGYQRGFPATKPGRLGVRSRPDGVPHPERTTAYEPLIEVVRGLDPIRRTPLKIGAGGVTPSDGALTPLASSIGAVEVTLKSLTLRKSFDFSLFGQATNELYLVAVAWDLSGAPPMIFPDIAKLGEVKGTYQAEKGDTITFLGDGLMIWPRKKIVGALYVRILVVESDEDVRKLGERITKAVKATKEAGLVEALAALAAMPTSATIAGVGVAALAFMSVLGSVLKDDGDDVVALFDGSYGAAGAMGTSLEAYEQRGARIEVQTVRAPEIGAGENVHVEPPKKKKSAVAALFEQTRPVA